MVVISAFCTASASVMTTVAASMPWKSVITSVWVISDLPSKVSGTVITAVSVMGPSLAKMRSVMGR